MPPPSPQVNPRNHHLAIARLHQRPHFGENALARQRTALSPHIRNHAERAAVVASILHLEVRTRPLVGRFKYRSRQQFGMRKNIPHNHGCPILARSLGKGGSGVVRVSHPCAFFAQGWDWGRPGPPSLRVLCARVGSARAPRKAAPPARNRNLRKKKQKREKKKSQSPPPGVCANCPPRSEEH